MRTDETQKMLKNFKMELQLAGYSENTIKNYLYSLNTLHSYVKKDLKKIEESDLKRFLSYLQTEKGVKTSTIYRHLNAIKTFFRLNDLEVAEKIKLPKLSKSLPEVLMVDEMRKILNSISNLRDLLIVRLLYASGLRVSELVGLNRRDIEGLDLKVIGGKGRKDRVTHIDETTLNLIQKYLDNRIDKNEALFINNRGKRLSQRTVQKIIRKHAKRAGIKKNVTPHTLRHSFATHLLQNDADIVVIRDLLGHSSLSTTQIYTHLTSSYRRKVYKNSHPLSKEHQEI
ncbi:MAG: site-specific tyrosine recombinase/integron integrase [Candidatus Methanofastidiosia archaeon]